MPKVICRGARFATTITNRPELFSNTLQPDNAETFAAQARENELSRRLLTQPSGYSTLSLPVLDS